MTTKYHKCDKNKEVYVFIVKDSKRWELEISEILNTFSEYVDIFYCPFCGVKL